MITYPNAKINLGLRVTEKRTDGYHNIVSCFYPIPWNDILEIIPSKELKFESTGIDIPGDSESNLCLKSYELLKKDFDIPPVHIYLHKQIPIGAGMGGGSSDAAFTLKMINGLFRLGCSNQKLEMYAKQLGSDCAFFIKNETVIAVNKGDDFLDCSLKLNKKWIVCIYPKIHIGTQEAYANITPLADNSNINDLLQKGIDKWPNKLFNDFEKSIFPNHPKIEKIKDLLYESGALYASMTGSGSTVYGIFNHDPSLAIFEKDEYLVKKMEIK